MEISDEDASVFNQSYTEDNLTYRNNNQSIFQRVIPRETIFYKTALERAERYQKSKGYPKMNKASVKKYFKARRDKLPDFMEQQFREAFFTNIFIDKFFRADLMPNGFYNSNACILGVLNDYELYYIAYESKLAMKYKYIQTKARLLLDILRIDIEMYRRKFQRK